MSMICLFLANLVRGKMDYAYGFFLGAGVVLFIIGVYKKFSAK